MLLCFVQDLIRLLARGLGQGLWAKRASRAARPRPRAWGLHLPLRRARSPPREPGSLGTRESPAPAPEASFREAVLSHLRDSARPRNPAVASRGPGTMVMVGDGVMIMHDVRRA